jgi:hypothetical protein
LTFRTGDFIIPTMGGRYGKYGEVKRLARLRRGRKETRFSKRGSELERDHTRRERARRKRFGGIRPEGEGKE